MAIKTTTARIRAGQWMEMVSPNVTSTVMATVSPAEAMRAVEAGRRP